MKIPLGWLRDFVDIDVNIKEFAHKLTMSGSKVESIEELGSEINKVVVGKVLEIKKHPNADKLIVTKVDVGEEVIQVATGATNVFEGALIPTALDGSTLPGGIKIKKGKLRGEESFGMMCSLEELVLSKDDFPDADEDGIFILPEKNEEGSSIIPGMCIKEVLGLNETVVEFEITPNRPDCLSIYGMAGEVAVTLGKTRKEMSPVVKEEGTGKTEDFVSVEIEAPDLCNRYIARAVTDVVIAPSPKWMRDRLRAAGVRAINNIVDITNYVMLELGQPLHAFDMRDIEGGQIKVRRATNGEKFKTLDDQERILESEMLVIADAKNTIGIAGVMGGLNSEIKDDTTTVIFESANFLGTSVRSTSKKLGLRTESSARFEKGLDPENALTAIQRVCELVELLACGKVEKGMIDSYPNRPEKHSIPFVPENINRHLGTHISGEQMLGYLKDLGFIPNEDNSAVEVPSHRMDVKREADLSEEVARLYDYNNIKPTLLDGKQATLGKKTFKQQIVDKIIDTMNACGLSEIYTYSFGSPKTFDLLRFPEDSKLRNTVVISNPLGEDYSVMRTTTIAEMLVVLARNFNRRAESAALFEISKVYLPVEGENLPEEKELLTIGMYGEYDFYSAKGVVEALGAKLGIDFEFTPINDNPTFHPGRTAGLYIGEKQFGILGEIHPEVAENFDAASRNYLGVIEIEPLVENALRIPEFKSLPKYPSTNRDLSILVDESVLVKDMFALIRQRGGKILESVELFDVYKGKQIPQGKKSVSFSLIFRGSDKTLTDEEVNKSMKKIKDGLSFEYGAELRL